MGTTAEKLQAIVSAKADIGAAIMEKRGIVPQKLSEYGNAIRALPTPPLEPVDAKRLYAAMRNSDWPPMPENVPENTFVFLYTGAGTASFVVTCEGQYTVESKLCTLVDGTWSYTVEETQTFTSETKFTKEFPAADTSEYRLLTISASTIKKVNFVNVGVDGRSTMPGCVELLYHISGIAVPIFSDMLDLVFATGLVKVGGTSSSNAFRDCKSLICVIAKDAHFVGNCTNMFARCEQLMAVDISMDENDNYATPALFIDCRSLTSIPPIFGRTASLSNAFASCTSLREVAINFETQSSIQMNTAFNRCYALNRISLSGPVNISNMSNAFARCVSLKHLILNLPNWSGLDFSIADCSFDLDGLVEMFRSLPTRAAAHSITITGNPGVADLTEEDKAIATSKGWTLVL